MDGTAGGRVHMPRLDLCILSRWSPSYETLQLAFPLKFYRVSLSENFGQAGKYGISSTMLSFDTSDHNGNTTPPTCWEFQIKHIWTLHGLTLRSTLFVKSKARATRSDFVLSKWLPRGKLNSYCPIPRRTYDWRSSVCLQAICIWLVYCIGLESSNVTQNNVTKPNNFERRLTNIGKKLNFVSLSCLLLRLSLPFSCMIGKYKACSVEWTVIVSSLHREAETPVIAIFGEF